MMTLTMTGQLVINSSLFLHPVWSLEHIDYAVTEDLVMSVIMLLKSFVLLSANHSDRLIPSCRWNMEECQ